MQMVGVYTVVVSLLAHFKFAYVIPIFRVKNKEHGVAYLALVYGLNLFASGKELKHYWSPLRDRL